MSVSTASTITRDFHAHPALHASLARLRQVTYHRADSEIYAQGDVAGSLYRVEYGAVRIYRLLSDGRRQIVAFHLPGEVFGFEARDTRSFFAESIVATSLSTMQADLDGGYSAELAALALLNMVRAQEHLTVIGRQNALEKLAVFLIDLHERQGGEGFIDLPMSRADIGDYLGMTIETVSRNLSKLRANGLVRLKTARCMEIVKPEALRRYAA